MILDMMCVLFMDCGWQNNSVEPPKMPLPQPMKAEDVTLDSKADLAERIERGFGQRYQINAGTQGRRLGEDVTMKRSQRGRLKNCTSSFASGHRKWKETPWGGP